MRKIVTGFGLLAGLALAAAPAAAQDAAKQAIPSQEDWDANSAELGAQLTVEPLTAEQQARLPQARALVERIMPPGTVQQMLGGMLDGLLAPVQPGANESVTVITQRFGYDLTANQADADEAATILDPNWSERFRRQSAMMPVIMGRMMITVEPVLRSTMAELYAVHFTTDELTGIDAFFATPIGAAYAQKSFGMASDPRLMASIVTQAMPQMYADIASMENDLAAATAGLPPERSYADLSNAERARLGQLLGLGEDELASYLEPPAAEEAAEIPVK